MRVSSVKEEALILVVYNSKTTRYYVLEKLPFQWKQIGRTLIVGWGSVVLIACGLVILSKVLPFLEQIGLLKRFW